MITHDIKLLKPCPFCYFIPMIEENTDTGYLRIVCPHCDSKSGDYLEEGDLLAAWNKRVPDNTKETHR
jgi:hypothetical protein